jgi:hypothetical protein
LFCFYSRKRLIAVMAEAQVYQDYEREEKHCKLDKVSDVMSAPPQ